MDVILKLSRHFHCKNIYQSVVLFQKSVFVDNSSIILAHMSPFMKNSILLPILVLMFAYRLGITFSQTR